jgi:hypothetical protein
LIVFVVVGCSAGPTTEQIQGTVIAQVTSLAKQATPYPTYTPLPTYTPMPTVAIKVEVTKIVIVTQTPTPTPLFTSTPTPEPAQATATAQAEIAAATATAKAEAANATATAQAETDVILKASREDGIWLVGVDIAPGLWRNNGTGDGCYWQRSTMTGDIIDNHFGQGGGTVYILKSDFQFETHDCGTWTYIRP